MPTTRFSIKALNESVGMNAWTFPPLISLRDHRRLGVTTDNPEAYFEERRRERSWLVDCIRSHFGMRAFSLCSIGSGYGGEESTLEPFATRTVLIEPDARRNEFLVGRFSPGVQVIKGLFQFSRFDDPFDVVYASALSCWMDSDPLDGIDADLFAFLSLHLKPGGLGIFLFNGSSHSSLMLGQEVYVQRLLQTAQLAGFKVLLYGRYQPRGTLLIVSNETVDVSGFASSLIKVYANEDRIVCHERAALSAYVFTAIAASYTLGRNVVKSCRDFFGSFRRIAQLRKPVEKRA
jgi:hypothetical protein